MKRITFASLSLALMLGPAALASEISIPVGNVSSSSEIAGGFNRQDDFIVNGNGLSGGLHDVAPDGGMWLSTGDAFGGEDPDPFVLFDLGDPYRIDSFRVWNYNEAGTLSRRGVNAVTVEYGQTNTLGSTVPGVTNFIKAPGANGYAGEVYDNFTPFVARYIKFDIDSNHGGDNNFYGLSEVRFDGTLVPEPASLTLLGFGGLLVARRRRAG